MRLASILNEQTRREMEIKSTFKYSKKELRQEMRQFRALNSRSNSIFKKPAKSKVLLKDESVQKIDSAPLINDSLKKKSKAHRSPNRSS
jgi:hypothetical protein